MDAMGDPIVATQDEIDAAKLLPFNQRFCSVPRGTVGPGSFDGAQDLQVVPEPSSVDQPMEVADGREVIEIDDAFAPSADSPPGTEGRDEHSQAPITTPGMEFVSITAPIPTEGDTEVEPNPLTEADELVVSNDPIDDEGYMSMTSSRIISSRQSSRASRMLTSQTMTQTRKSCLKNQFLLQPHWK